MTTHLLKILVTGADGQVGTAIRNQAITSQHPIAALDRTQLDITVMSAIKRAIHQHMPDIIINAAAYTAVDKAEQVPVDAMQVNYYGPKNLAVACQQAGIALMHFSTDYVFSGVHTLPYSEEDPIAPLNVYGKSKWLGEQAVREHLAQHIIIRTSGVFSPQGSNFVKTILRLAQERKILRIVADQVTCPTSANDIANMTLTIANRLSKWGTYHFCSSQGTSWFAFAKQLISVAKAQTSLNVEHVEAITTSEYAAPAKRPAYSVLDCQKIYDIYGIRQPCWQAALDTMIPLIIRA